MVSQVELSVCCHARQGSSTCSAFHLLQAAEVAATAVQLLQCLQHELSAIDGQATAAAEEGSSRQASEPQSIALCQQLLHAAATQRQAALTACFGTGAAALLQLCTSLAAEEFSPSGGIAVQCAALLRAHWQRPEQQAAAALELAQAAATRSCAYLRCANLSGSGGAAAKEGEGSKRCSGCRAVWYCGTACSHADWRAGHKRMCKALGEARQQEREREQLPLGAAGQGA